MGENIYLVGDINDGTDVEFICINYAEKDIIRGIYVTKCPIRGNYTVASMIVLSKKRNHENINPCTCDEKELGEIEREILTKEKIILY